MRQTIGSVARALGLKPKTIRYYEEIGVVPPPHRGGSGWLSAGRRLYTEKDIERLRFVKEARHLDFSLDDIRQLLEKYENGPPCGCAARPFLKTLVLTKLEEIDAALEALQALRAELRSLSARLGTLDGKTPADLLQHIPPTPVDALLRASPPPAKPPDARPPDMA